MEVRQVGKGACLPFGEIDSVLRSQVCEHPRMPSSLRSESRSANHQVKVLLSVCSKVAHFMVDSEADLSCRNMRPEERRGKKKIEQDSPAANLRMSITPGVILPLVAKFVRNPSSADGPDEQIWSEQFRGEWSDHDEVTLEGKNFQKTVLTSVSRPGRVLL